MPVHFGDEPGGCLVFCDHTGMSITAYFFTSTEAGHDRLPQPIRYAGTELWASSILMLPAYLALIEVIRMFLSGCWIPLATVCYTTLAFAPLTNCFAYATA